jgi:hypothetical protein
MNTQTTTHTEPSVRCEICHNAPASWEYHYIEAGIVKATGELCQSCCDVAEFLNEVSEEIEVKIRVRSVPPKDSLIG